MPSWFLGVIAAVAAVAGAIASVASAGVDSLITPALSLETDMRTAVLAVSAPHLVFNALRCWTIRDRISWKVFRRFGLASAIGSLGGALLHQVASSGWITVVFAVLLIIAGLFGITGFAERARLGRRGAYVGGALSGFFGGLTGEQGGLRAAAMLGLGCEKEVFVATATATAIVVDLVRLPVYVATRWSDLPEAIAPALVSSAGVVVGVLAGGRVLRKVPQHRFGQVVSAVLLLIGALMIVRLFIGR
ncbi:MAG TPA: sulfite exporter TauE/SafE family protein [Myxococcales bacterium]|nr:sulfite exporter TauE/SafE family protein [Myxococcales bacterium]